MKLQAEQVDDSVLVSVIDNGIGISTQDRSIIFEEFRQVATPGLSVQDNFIVQGQNRAIESELCSTYSARNGVLVH